MTIDEWVYALIKEKGPIKFQAIAETNDARAMGQTYWTDAEITLSLQRLRCRGRIVYESGSCTWDGTDLIPERGWMAVRKVPE